MSEKYLADVQKDFSSRISLGKYNLIFLKFCRKKKNKQIFPEMLMCLDINLVFNVQFKDQHDLISFLEDYKISKL